MARKTQGEDDMSKTQQQYLAGFVHALSAMPAGTRLETDEIYVEKQEDGSWQVTGHTSYRVGDTIPPRSLARMYPVPSTEVLEPEPEEE